MPFGSRNTNPTPKENHDAIAHRIFSSICSSLNYAKFDIEKDWVPEFIRRAVLHAGCHIHWVVTHPKNSHLFSTAIAAQVIEDQFFHEDDVLCMGKSIVLSGEGYIHSPYRLSHRDAGGHRVWSADLLMSKKPYAFFRLVIPKKPTWRFLDQE